MSLNTNSIIKQSVKKVLLRGGNLVFPGKKIIKNPDIYIENGIIKKIGKSAVKDAQLITLTNDEYISPGFIDLHCHLREPGNEKSESIQSGTLSAIAGGFTQVCCMPNTNPPIDNPKIVRYIYAQAEKADNAMVSVIGSVTKNRKGKTMADIEKMIEAGIVAVSDDGAPVYNAEIMRDALMYCQKFDIPVINHCEILGLSKNGVMNLGKTSECLGLKGIPDSAESIMVLRDILLAEQTNSWVHIAHVSTKKSVEIISWAKRRGIRVTAETCPHYFTLTDKECLSLNTNYKVSPPLRTEADIEAIKQGLVDGVIDAIATDHAPWHYKEKNPLKPQIDAKRSDSNTDENKKKKNRSNPCKPWLQNASNWIKAKSGMIGFETAFSLGYQELVLKKYLSLEKYLACLTTKPAQILKQLAEIKENSPAVLAIFNLNKTWTQTPTNITSKSKNSPFVNKKLKGEITRVIIKDKIFKSV